MNANMRRIIPRESSIFAMLVLYMCFNVGLIVFLIECVHGATSMIKYILTY